MVNPTIGAELRPTRRRVSSGWSAFSTLIGALTIVAVGAGCTSKPNATVSRRLIALPFIENDYAKAVQTARDANLPLFVEVWAPW